MLHVCLLHVELVIFPARRNWKSRLSFMSTTVPRPRPTESWHIGRDQHSECWIAMGAKQLGEIDCQIGLLVSSWVQEQMFLNLPKAPYLLRLPTSGPLQLTSSPFGFLRSSLCLCQTSRQSRLLESFACVSSLYRCLLGIADQALDLLQGGLDFDHALSKFEAAKTCLKEIP